MKKGKKCKRLKWNIEIFEYDSTVNLIDVIGKNMKRRNSDNCNFSKFYGTLWKMKETVHLILSFRFLKLIEIYLLNVTH